MVERGEVRMRSKWKDWQWTVEDGVRFPNFDDTTEGKEEEKSMLEVEPKLDFPHRQHKIS